MFQFQSQRYSALALHEAKRHFYLCTQDKNSTCQHFYETFKNNLEVVEYCGGIICKDTGLVDGEVTCAGLTRDAATPDELSVAEAAARERVLACAFLFGPSFASLKGKTGVFLPLCLLFLPTSFRCIAT
jgi:hypothetical protein